MLFSCCNLESNILHKEKDAHIFWDIVKNSDSNQRYVLFGCFVTVLDQKNFYESKNINLMILILLIR